MKQKIDVFIIGKEPHTNSRDTDKINRRQPIVNSPGNKKYTEMCAERLAFRIYDFDRVSQGGRFRALSGGVLSTTDVKNVSVAFSLVKFSEKYRAANYFHLPEVYTFVITN